MAAVEADNSKTCSGGGIVKTAPVPVEAEKVAKFHCIPQGMPVPLLPEVIRECLNALRTGNWSGSRPCQARGRVVRVSITLSRQE